MASKSIKAKKQELLASLEGRRSSINDRANQVQGSLKQIPTEAKAQTEKLRNITPQTKGGRSFSIVDKFQTLSTKANRVSLMDKVKGENKATQWLSQSSVNKGIIPSNTKLHLPSDLPVKPILIGLGALLVLGAISGKKKKKRANKKLIAQAKEHNQVAKFGFGILILKWLLGASQPAVKHLVTKKVKKGLLG